MTWRKELEEALAALELPTAELERGAQDDGFERNRRSVTEVISRHPVLTELLPTSDRWHLHSLASGFPYNTDGLRSALTDHVLRAAQKTGIATASRTCEAFLNSAAETRLPGFDLTLFAGLDLAERWDLAPGQYAVPYPTIEPQLARPWARFPTPAFLGLELKDLKNTTALVTELRWGPTIADANRKLTDPDPKKIELAYDRAPLLVVALLSVVLRRPLPVVATTFRSAPWIDEFLDRVDGSSSIYDSKGHFGSVDSGAVNAEAQSAAARAIQDWDSCAKSERETLVLPIARLSTSLLRRGSWAMPNLAVDDQVLDISIALEILYSLDSFEITHKLSTRAGWYLGSNAEDRLRIRKCLTNFYRLRSDVVHGGKRKKKSRKRMSRDPKRELQREAFVIARDTVLEHLRRGRTPDEQQWNEIVMDYVPIDQGIVLNNEPDDC